MKILITGICGFVGSSLAAWLRENHPAAEVSGLDSLVRPGSETNRLRLARLGVTVRHGDVRLASDFESLPAADWVVDAAANPSVLAGVDGRTSSRQLVEHNLGGTVNILEYCRRHGAGFVLLSTSRVYSIAALSAVPVAVKDGAFAPDPAQPWPAGLSAEGVGEDFSTASPVSLYGGTKLASETLALEYGSAFGFPVWVNRCGVLAGAGQFGTAEQGIFSYWLSAWRGRHPLRYIGYGGSGHQVRDAFHPRDLAALVWKQFEAGACGGPRLFNLGGGPRNAMSLAQLSRWCEARWGRHTVTADPAPRPFDIPWFAMDSRRAMERFGWLPATGLPEILGEIAQHAEANPDWRELVR